MEEQKSCWIIDCLIVLAMMVLVIVLCHPLGRSWTEEEMERYIGAEGGYSPDVDSYYYLRKAKEFSLGGVKSIRLISYRASDTKCTSGETILREANGAMPQLLPASAAFVWYCLRAVGIEVGIYTVAMQFCAFLLSLFVIPVYLFLKRRTTRIAAVLGALMVALEPPFFRHSHVSFFDTDALIGLLALVLVLSLFESFVQKNRMKQLIYGGIAIVAFFLLRFTWTAFFVYGVISVGTALMGLIGVRLCGKYGEEQKKRLLIPAGCCAVIVVFSLVLGWDSFVSLAKGFVSSSNGARDWPSETLGISELRRLPLSDAKTIWHHFVGVRTDVTSVLGGMFALLLLLVSTGICCARLICAIRNHSEETERVFLLSALLTWLAGTTLLAFFGARYMEFVVLPSAIVAAVGFDCLGTGCKKKTTSEKRILFVFAGIMLFCSMVLCFPVAAVFVSSVTILAGWFLSKRDGGGELVIALALVIALPIGISCWVICAEEVPYIEKSVEEAMIWVKENTATDAVLVDFWNLGYIYQYYGERRTIADGGTYNGQFFYWLAEMLTTDNPQLSVGIARMLQNCGIDGSEYAQELLGNASDTRGLLKEILALSRSEAEIRLKEECGFSEKQRTRLLDYTHPMESPDIFFVASHNTFEILSGLIVLYRNWEKGGNEAQEGTYYSAEAVLRPNEGETAFSKLTFGGDDSLGAWVSIKCSDGVLTGWIVTPEGERFDCGRVIYSLDGKVVYDEETELFEGQNAASNEALMILEEGGVVSVVLLEKSAPDSTFIKLFLSSDETQEVFENVFNSEKGTEIQKRLDDNSSISIWKVISE